MAESASHQITGLLTKWKRGDEGALDELIPLVYGELRRMARGYLRRRPSPMTFQTSDLIHETYLKLAKGGRQEWQDRSHFFGVAAVAMRHILVDCARAKLAQKRWAQADRLSLNENLIGAAGAAYQESAQIVALEDALKMLTAFDPRKGQVVEMKFYGGLTNEEAAEALKISVETVKRDWRFARAWLLREIENSN
jgi:RNA polymerase sigma factor (TIGR02999 family)